MLDFDIDKMCRVCLETNLELYLLFDEQNAIDGVFLSQIISDITIFKVRRHDEFPHQICFHCMEKVRRAYEFKKLFETSHRKLLSYLEPTNKLTIDLKPDNKNDKCIQTEDSTLFPCEKCDEKFMSYHRLREHRLVSHKGTPNICRFCCKSFMRLADLKNHIAVRHPETNNFNPPECPVCNKKFARKEHVNRHLSKIHKIEYEHLSDDEASILNETGSNDGESGILLETEIDYTNLIKEENPCEILPNNNPEDFAIDDCSMENPFSAEDDIPLSGLQKTIHAKNVEDSYISPTEHSPDDSKSLEIEIIKNEEPQPIGSSQETTSSPFKCNLCDKSFGRNSTLKRHSLSHLEEKPFQCKICDKKFKRSDHLKSHASKHGETETLKCEYCDREFNRLDLLKRHKEKTHNIEWSRDPTKLNHCKFCNKSFSSKAYLQKHMSLHTNMSWKCKLCPAEFQSREALKEHNKSHNKEKPYLCSECGMRFARNDYLLIHMRRHTGEKPYKCRYCNKGFPRATDLNVHEKYHTGERTHLCSVCGKGFQRSYNLVVHMRVHTGEKPYKCSHCPKSFAQCNDLKAHIRRHTGERYKCKICGIGFIQGYNLTQHNIDVHGVEGQARKGRVYKVKPNTSIAEVAPENADIQPIEIKIEQESYNISFNL